MAICYKIKKLELKLNFCEYKDNALNHQHILILLKDTGKFKGHPLS